METAETLVRILLAFIILGMVIKIGDDIIAASILQKEFKDAKKRVEKRLAKRRTPTNGS